MSQNDQTDTCENSVIQTRIGRLIALILNNAKLYFGGVFIAMFFAAIISLIMPKTFESYSVVFPPSGDNAMNVSSLVQGLALGGFSLGGDATAMSLLISMVKSRTMLEGLIDEFDLLEELKTDKWEDALIVMRDRVECQIMDEGTLMIKARDKTGWFSNSDDDAIIRQRVMQMAEYLLVQLDKVNLARTTEEASNFRIDIEKRYAECLQELAEAEDEYQLFIEEHGVLELPTQLEHQVNSAAVLYSRIVEEDVKLEVLSASLPDDHPSIQGQEMLIESLRQHYDELIAGTDSQLFLSFEDIPELGKQLVRLEREIMIQGEIFKFLAPQVEDARLREKKEAPTLVTLDFPKQPDKRVAPSRSVLVLSVGILTALLLLLLLLLRSLMQRDDSFWMVLMREMKS
jgi:capsule polysaccharide export protein KpsE/RkpR